VSANRETLSDGGRTPVAPAGVRARAVVAGHWVLLVFSFTVAVAAVVFVLLPRWLAPGRVPAPPAAKSMSAPAAEQAPISAQTPTPEQTLASAKAPPPLPPAQEETHARASEASDAAQPDRAIDPTKGPNKEAPPRANRNAADQRFAQLMSRGLAHAERAEWPEAEQAFSAAARLRPADRAAADGLARAKEGLERSQVATLRSEAQRFESEERWADALAAYRQALRIDPTLSFAKRGGEHSESMARLYAELDTMLADPKRLYSPRVRDAARQALAAADAVPGGGPRLAEARARLEAALNRATTPIAVRFTSDEATEVTIYRVGSLGRFRARDMELAPGAYTVVGARAGYKDVRIELTVEPDAPAPEIFVACREPV
jgi:tetratricopeptide (TPR) repeat protein